MVIVVPPPALRRDIGRREQPLFLHAHQCTAGNATGVRCLRDLKEALCICFHPVPPKKHLLRSWVNELYYHYKKTSVAVKSDTAAIS